MRNSLAIFLLLLPGVLTATDYDVGPGQTYPAIGDVPWESLAPGDRVLIHWRANPYHEKWVIARRGTEADPIVVRGIAGPGGQRPMIDGRDATTRTALDYWNEERGVIKIGGSNVPSDTLPAWIEIEGLEIRSARPPFAFSGDSGQPLSYADNAASIYIEKAEHVTIRGCVIHDSGNGIFIGAYDGQTRDITIERNHIHSNGIVSSAYQHNTYTEAIDIVYEANRFGPLRAGADGNNLKDRSAGLVVRYNWIESGNRQLDLVDAGSASLTGDPSYRETFVYGNVLVEDESGNSQIVHYGGDSGTTANYRKGTLFFYNNTLVSTRSGNTTLLRLSTDDETADVRNNLLYVTAGGDRLAMLDSDGVLDLSHNWLRPAWQDSHGSLSGTIDDDGTSVLGASPGFVDLPGQDFHLAAGSTAIGAATTLHPDAASHPLAYQYLEHADRVPRPMQGVLDIGAFEWCEVAECPLFRDGFESGDTSDWSATSR